MAGNGPTTEIEIQSNAALLLGKSPFTTIDNADKFAVSVQKLYDMLVPAELGSNAWKFAKKQVQLSQIAGFDPDFAEYEASYALPGDMLNIVRLYPMVWYQIFENRLYTGTTGELKMEYTYNAPVVSWNPAFKAYMTATIAYQMCLSITENPQLMQMLGGLVKQYRAQAMYLDGQNSPNRGIASSPWIAVRGGRYNRPGSVGIR